MANKRLALNADGEMTYCSASEENIGKGRCNHVAHQKDGESQIQFMNRANEESNNKSKENQIIENRVQLLEKINKFQDKKNPLLASYDQRSGKYNIGGYLNPLLETDDFENYEASGLQTATVGLLDNEYEELHSDQKSIDIIKNYDLNSNKIKMIKEFKIPLLPNLDDENHDGNYVLELEPDLDKFGETVSYKDGKFEQRLKDLQEELTQDHNSGLSYEEIRNNTEKDIIKYSKLDLEKSQKDYQEKLNEAIENKDESMIDNYQFRYDQLEKLKDIKDFRNVEYSNQVMLGMMAIDAINRDIDRNDEQDLRIKKNKISRFS